jgi:predicted proteasome-type protease
MPASGSAQTVRRVHQRDARALHEFGVDFNCRLIPGGQIASNRPASVPDLPGRATSSKHRP